MSSELILNFILGCLLYCIVASKIGSNVIDTSSDRFSSIGNFDFLIMQLKKLFKFFAHLILLLSNLLPSLNDILLHTLDLL